LILKQELHEVMEEAVHYLFRERIDLEAASLDKARTDNSVTVTFLHSRDQPPTFPYTVDKIAIHRQHIRSLGFTFLNPVFYRPPHSAGRLSF